MSGMFTLNSKDFLKGLIVAVMAAVFATLAQWLNAPGFEFTSFNWGELLKIAIAAGTSYLGKNLFSDSDGKVLGSIG